MMTLNCKKIHIITVLMKKKNNKNNKNIKHDKYYKILINNIY